LLIRISQSKIKGAARTNLSTTNGKEKQVTEQFSEQKHASRFSEKLAKISNDQ